MASDFNKSLLTGQPLDTPAQRPALGPIPKGVTARMYNTCLDWLREVVGDYPSSPPLLAALLQLPIGIMLNGLAALPKTAADAALWQSQCNKQGSYWVLELVRRSVIDQLVTDHQPEQGHFDAAPELVFLLDERATKLHDDWLSQLLKAAKTSPQT